MSAATLSPRARYAVLFAAIGGLMFDGVELGLMPVAALSVSQSLLGNAYTPTLGGDWFARFTAALMLGAAVGGIFLGSLGDRIGRTRALGISILFYSVFAGLGALVRTQEQMLLLRFLVGLGVGGVWPNAVALAAECWPDKSRPVVAGLMGAALNAGILVLSQVARTWHITPESWRWIFWLAAAPAVLGLLVLFALPESPLWLAARAARSSLTPSGERAGSRRQPTNQPLRELFRPPLLRLLVIGILLGSIPMVGAWAASKWMIPWADTVGGTSAAGYKAVTQGWWALGAMLGSFFGAQIAAWLGRRRAYALISAGATALTSLMFLGTAPLQASFLPIVFAQGFVATLFFGWLPLYLPELFPTRVRAAGSGIAYNVGRFATAAGVLMAGVLFAAMGGSYPKVGALCGLIYLLGLIVIWWAPDTSKKQLAE
ncbi:MAG TPA: MFS transporter [Verrucomicrobiota bacterium]|nr:MFS transporter [Verrucomicrobiota bacterium]HRZ34824.1 MFS transporter [Candidatus Paceibacterota bacterium]HRZ57090.1 MFS transporter [Candidatus Paceibacterota bacterium]